MAAIENISTISFDKKNSVNFRPNGELFEVHNFDPARCFNNSTHAYLFKS